MITLLCRIFAIIGLGVTIGAADSWRRPTTVAASDGIVMIDAARAKEMFDKGIVFLDARIESAFQDEHVAQAFWLNSKTFGTPAAEEAMQVLDASQPVVIYCDGGDCDASKNLAILLQQAGFSKIYIFEAGFPDWKEHGFPVESTKP